jgi:hypothetical protein
MRIGLLDEDGRGFPNLALMKISTYHRKLGDTVEFCKRDTSYDVVYASKVFTSSATVEHLKADLIVRGGTGNSVTDELPPAIHGSNPDFNLYNCEHAYGFLTRGCVNKCYFCVVPKKEGNIRAESTIQEILQGKRSAILMDNNVLASDYGIRQIEEIARLGVKVDFNQGLDHRILAEDKPLCRLLSKVRWLKPLRIAFDNSSNDKLVVRAIQNLREAKVKPSRYSCYVLVKDIEDALYRVLLLKYLNVDSFAQPYRDLNTMEMPDPLLRAFARWVNHKAVFNATTWEDYRYNKKGGDRC